jgi:hypothetical protein
MIGGYTSVTWPRSFTAHRVSSAFALWNVKKTCFWELVVGESCENVCFLSNMYLVHPRSFGVDDRNHHTKFDMVQHGFLKNGNVQWVHDIFQTPWNTQPVSVPWGLIASPTLDATNGKSPANQQEIFLDVDYQRLTMIIAATCSSHLFPAGRIPFRPRTYDWLKKKRRYTIPSNACS